MDKHLEFLTEEKTRFLETQEVEKERVEKENEAYLSDDGYNEYLYLQRNLD